MTTYDANELLTEIRLDPIFWPPTRMDVISAWWEHVPFAHLLVTEMRPKTIVELGTHFGVSFAAFCEAMQKNNIAGKCYAIDTWKGDNQAGLYGEEVYNNIKSFVDGKYRFCGELIRSTFDEALNHFDDNSIDLLHIDGLHTYQAVKADFNSWKVKLKDPAVVLFHDTNVLHGDFGVHRLWGELKQASPSFEFLHGHGLGVLLIGTAPSSFVSKLCNLNDAATKSIRERFAYLGARWTIHDHLNRLRQQMSLVDSKLANQHSERELLESKLSASSRNLADAEAQCVLLQNQLKLRERLRSKQADRVLALEHETRRSAQRIRGLISQNKLVVDLIKNTINGSRNDRLQPNIVPSDTPNPLRQPSTTRKSRDEALAQSSSIADGSIGNSEQNDAELIRSSGYFDNDYYAGQIEAILTGVDPALHYLRSGESAGLAPSEKFDPVDYAALNPDVAQSGQNLLLHYIRHGRAEGRAIRPHEQFETNASEIDDAMQIKSSEFFDEHFYKGTADPLAAGIDPALHYLRSGESAGLAPSEKFDPVDYAALNPDVAQSGQNLLLHYIRHGRAEGRKFSTARKIQLKNFDENFEKKNIIFITHEASRTGAPVLAYNMILELTKKYNVVTVIKRDGLLLKKFDEISSATILIPDEFIPNEIECGLIVSRLIDKYRPLYVIANSVESRCFVPPFEQNGVPTVSLIHEFSTYKWLPAGTLQDLFELSSGLVFSTTLTAESAIDNYPAVGRRTYHVIPQGRSIVPISNQFENNPSVRDDANVKAHFTSSQKGVKYIIGMGKITPRKGIEFFIVAAAHVAMLSADHSYRFVWIGSCNDDDAEYFGFLKEQLSRSEARQIMTFCEEFDDPSIAYSLTDVFFLSSRLDPLPNVAIDAASEGIPVVCFDNASGFADLVKSNGALADLVVPHLNAEEAARCVLRICAEDRLQNYSLSSKEWAQTTFDMVAYVAKVDEVARSAERNESGVDRDYNLILSKGAFNATLYAGGDCVTTRPAQLLRRYLKASRNAQPLSRPGSGHIVRRPLEGFNPLVYAEKNKSYDESSGKDPLAHYVETGRPIGPWVHEILRPAEWSSTLDKKLTVCVHAHFHYTDNFAEFVERIKNHADKDNIDIFVTTGNDENVQKMRDILARFGSIDSSVILIPNRGRNIGGLLTGLRATLAQYDLICHIHGKRTPHLPKEIGDRWRTFLWDNILGKTGEMLDFMLASFANDHSLGLVFPTDRYLNDWDENLYQARLLASKMGLSEELPVHFDFPQGAMFWARVAALQPLTNLELDWSDYPEEPIASDGTMLHSLERLFPFVVKHSGYKTAATYLGTAIR